MTEWKDAAGNVPALLNVPEQTAAMREALGPTEEAQAQPLLRELVRRFCEALPEDIEKATVAELIGMCELECNVEHERAVAAEQTVRRLALLREDAQTLARALEHSNGYMGGDYQAAFDRVQSDAYNTESQDDDESDDLTCEQKLELSEQAHLNALEEAHKLTNKVGELTKLLHSALLDADEEKESWIDEARAALGLRPEFNLRKAYVKACEAHEMAMATSEERLQLIWQLEQKLREQGGEHWQSGVHNRMADSDPGVFGDRSGAIESAMLEPTVVKALVSVAIWDSERLVRQAFRRAKYGYPEGKPLWETHYEDYFAEVITRFDRKALSPNDAIDDGDNDIPPGPMNKALDLLSQALEQEFGSRHHARYLGLALKEALLYLHSLPVRVGRAKEEAVAIDTTVALSLLQRHLET